MKNFLVLTTVFFCSLFGVFSAFGADPLSVCKRDSQEIQRIARDKEMRFYADNNGGLLGGGVCWWHSRFQRAAWYLMEFKPEKPKPTTQQAEKIIDDIAHLRGVVEIPGYRNFYRFSSDFEEQIQKELNHWEARDAFVNQQWLRGLSKKAQYKPERAAEWIAKLFETYLDNQKKNRITWVKLQIPGIVAHSALILSMARDGKNNYKFEVVDSGYPWDIQNWKFDDGEESVTQFRLYYPFEKMMPFSGFEKDFEKIDAAVKEYCSP